MILWLHQHFLRRHDERWVCHLQRSLELDVRARSLLRVASSQVATLRFVMARTCGMISHGVQRFLMLFNGESQPKCDEILTKEMSKFFWLWVWLDTKILVAYNSEDLIGQQNFEQGTMKFVRLSCNAESRIHLQAHMNVMNQVLSFEKKIPSWSKMYLELNVF